MLGEPAWLTGVSRATPGCRHVPSHLDHAPTARAARSVQVVASERDGGTVRQRILRHVGVAMDGEQLEQLKQVGEFIRAKLLDERSRRCSRPGRSPGGGPTRAPGNGWREFRVDLEQLAEKQRLVGNILAELRRDVVRWSRRHLRNGKKLHD